GGQTWRRKIGVGGRERLVVARERLEHQGGRAADEVGVWETRDGVGGRGRQGHLHLAVVANLKWSHGAETIHQLRARAQRGDRACARLRAAPGSWPARPGWRGSVRGSTARRDRPV